MRSDISSRFQKGMAIIWQRDLQGLVAAPNGHAASHGSVRHFRGRVLALGATQNYVREAVCLTARQSPFFLCFILAPSFLEAYLPTVLHLFFRHVHSLFSVVCIVSVFFFGLKSRLNLASNLDETLDFSFSSVDIQYI